MIGKRLFVLLACLFVVMIGFGITLPVLPFYVERLAQAEGATPRAIVMHVALLTAAYPLGQLVFAPVWGRWSDRTGRRPLLLMGIAGYVIAQILFGLATSLWLLYVARILGGVLSSATLPVSAAYVADATTEGERGRGMAWLGTAASLGFVVGPALGGVLARRDFHFTARYGHLMIDGFSIPFFAAAVLGLCTLAAAIRWLPESLSTQAPRSRSEETDPDWRTLGRSLGPLLGLALVAQFALAMFEATFALHAQAILNYGPAEVGAVFVVCGLVMAVFQVGASGLLAGRVGEMGQIGMGFVFRLGPSRPARAGDGAHRSEPCCPDLETRWEPARRHRARRPECSQQPRAGERSTGRRRALRLANERAVCAQRRSAGGNRSGDRVDGTGRTADSHTRVMVQLKAPSDPAPTR